MPLNWGVNMWAVLLGWFILSIVLHIGERRGVRMANPSADLPDVTSWWNIFIWPFKTVWRVCNGLMIFIGEHIWRLFKG